MKYDVGIIGSGVSAMTSALLFAKKGKKTAIFEQAPTFAPLLSGFNRKGIHFETGFHYSGALGEDEAVGFLFRQLGVDIPIEPCNPDGYDEIFLTDSQRIFKMPIGRQRWEQRLNEFFPKEAAGIKKYLDLIEITLGKIPFLNIHKKNFSDEELLFFEDDKKTLSQVLDECFSDDEIKSLLSFYCTLYGSPPSITSFVFHCCCAGIMFESVWKIKGGGGVFVQRMKDALKKEGVEIFLNKKVEKISVEGNKKVIAFSDNSQASCDIAVSTVHPKEFIRIAPSGVYREKVVERIMSLRETGGFFMLYGAVKEKSRHENMNISSVHSCDFRADHKDFLSLHFSHNTVCAMTSAPSDENFWRQDYELKKARLAQNVQNRIEENWKELSDKIDFFEISTPLTMKRYVNYYGAYGIMHHIDSANIMPITKTAGLFVIGQAAVAPGLVGAMISAFLLDKLYESRGLK